MPMPHAAPLMPGVRPWRRDDGGSMIGLLSRSLANLLFVNSTLPSCCRLLFLPTMTAALLLAITYLLRILAALMQPCSDRSDWLNKQQQKAMLLLGDRYLSD